METAPLIERRRKILDLHLLRPSFWMKELAWPSGFGVAGFLIWQFFRLMQMAPDRAWALLERWGPNFIITLIVLAVLSAALSRVMDILERNANAQTEQAIQLGKISDRLPDERTTQEMQIQIAYIAQQVGQSLEETRRQNRAFERIENKLGINAEDGGKS